jgi:pimeloyl-[acyl-carrier protein] methyl ester esterase
LSFITWICSELRICKKIDRIALKRPVDMAFFTTPDGVNIHYDVEGEGAPLLFLHGWAMCSRVWTHQVAHLAGDYQVFCPDLPGHGKSGCSSGACDFVSLTRDIALLIEGLGLERMTLVGWSIGASVALMLAAAHCLPVDSLVLVDGTPSFMARDGFPHGLPAAVLRRMLKLADADFSRALQEFHGLLLSEQDQALPSGDEVRDLLTNEQYLPQRDAARSLLASLAGEDLRDKLGGIRIPCLLMHGDQDKICPPGASVYMQERLARAELITFPGAGHAPFLTRADDFNHSLAAFLRSV